MLSGHGHMSRPPPTTPRPPTPRPPPGSTSYAPAHRPAPAEPATGRRSSRHGDIPRPDGGAAPPCGPLTRQPPPSDVGAHTPASSKVTPFRGSPLIKADVLLEDELQGERLVTLLVDWSGGLQLAVGGAVGAGPAGDGDGDRHRAGPIHQPLHRNLALAQRQAAHALVGERRRRAVRVRPWPYSGSPTPVPDWQIEALKVVDRQSNPSLNWVQRPALLATHRPC
jgi:hypothetical protein